MVRSEMTSLNKKKMPKGSRLSRRMCSLFCAFALLYVSVPPALTLVDPRFRGEVYPLSMWSMFYRVHNQMEDFGIWIVEVDGAVLSSKIRFEASDLPQSHSISAYHAIQKLGRAVSSKKQKDVARTRRTVERAYLGKKSIRYEVVERTWDPYERFLTGAVRKESLRATFTTRERGQAR